MANLEDWIIEQGLRGSDVGSLLAGFAERLAAEGIPLVRAYLALPTVNPTIRVYTHVWTRSGGLLVEGVSHERNADAFELSPFAYMMRTNQTSCHWLVDDPAARKFDVFDEVKREGGTDYLARLFSFDNASAPDLLGIGISFSCSRPEGFRPEEIARIDALLPLLGLAAYRMTLFDLTVAMLDTYVGLSAGRRVLSGEIRRGFGTTLTAALLFADLRGFTALADTAGMDLIAGSTSIWKPWRIPWRNRAGRCSNSWVTAFWRPFRSRTSSLAIRPALPPFVQHKPRSSAMPR